MAANLAAKMAANLAAKELVCEMAASKFGKEKKVQLILIGLIQIFINVFSLMIGKILTLIIILNTLFLFVYYKI